MEGFVFCFLLRTLSSWRPCPGVDFFGVGAVLDDVGAVVSKLFAILLDEFVCLGAIDNSCLHHFFPNFYGEAIAVGVVADMHVERGCR